MVGAEARVGAWVMASGSEVEVGAGVCCIKRGCQRFVIRWPGKRRAWPLRVASPLWRSGAQRTDGRECTRPVLMRMRERTHSYWAGASAGEARLSARPGRKVAGQESGWTGAGLGMGGRAGEWLAGCRVRGPHRVAADKRWMRPRGTNAPGRTGTFILSGRTRRHDWAGAAERLPSQQEGPDLSARPLLRVPFD